MFHVPFLPVEYINYSPHPFCFSLSMAGKYTTTPRTRVRQRWQGGAAYWMGGVGSWDGCGFSCVDWDGQRGIVECGGSELVAIVGVDRQLGTDGWH